MRLRRRLSAVVLFSTLALGGVLVAAGQRAASAPSASRQSTMTFDSGRAWEHLRRQVGFGPRPSGSQALAQTRQYIIDQLKAAGLTAQQQTWTAKTPAGDIPMVNLIATIPGRRRDRIIVASHYDTKRSPDFRFVGASDGASWVIPCPGD